MQGYCTVLYLVAIIRIAAERPFRQNISPHPTRAGLKIADIGIGDAMKIFKGLNLGMIN